MREIWLICSSKKPTPEIKKGLKNSDWNVEEVQYKNLPDLLGSRIPDCAILISDDTAPAKSNKIGGKNGWVARSITLIKDIDDQLPIITLIPKGLVKTAVDIMKSGVYDCLIYPISADGLFRTVENGIRYFDLVKKVYLLESETRSVQKFDNIIGQAPKMREVFQLIKMVSKSVATVLILGESGTGKELVARAVHRHSNRTKKPFVDINCGAIPHELLENELFGHEKGAYTGADQRYIGSFERADGGTVFLDEISEMHPQLQVKLLRFLQERTINRVGGTVSIKLDVRVIAATNRNLEEEVKKGQFREDLFYRLNVVPVSLPSLRERKTDVPILAQHFLQKYSVKNERIFMDLAPQALDALTSYDWPGNVRELENVMERVVVLHNDSRVKVSHLPPVVRECKKSKFTGISSTSDDSILPLDQIERYAIEDALRKCMGNIAETARKLDIGQATLYRKIRKYGLRG